jgi:GT2 family glycosyltransferase
VAAEPRVVAVLVTWNRRSLLAESLAAVRDQVRPPDAVVVVDNASTDGSAELVRADFPFVHLLELGTNIGGAGGFAAGLARGLTLDADLVWLLDDDTVPEPTALSALLDARRAYLGTPPALVASRVVWTDGRDHPMNTPRSKPWAGSTERAAAASVGCLPIRSASFVSALCDAGVVTERGLPVADYFLWNDDFEFTTRLLRGRRGLYCPASVVVHKTTMYGGTEADPGERFYFEVRNKLWLFSRSSGLNPLEKVLYAGASARRWAGTLAHSSDRRTLICALGRGAYAAARSGPRDTALLLAAAGADSCSGERAVSERVRFSLLLPCYAGDRPDFLREAFRSTVVDQTRRPDDVVLVQDGPVPAELAECVRELIDTSPVPVQHLVIEANLGLGPALDRGLAACRYDVVARMDADDISLPHRFEAQLPLIESGADIVGSSLLEFGTDPADVLGQRTPPLDAEQITGYSRFHDPFNHPTVVYRRSAVRAVGGYQDLPLMEDYLLFARMLAAGAQPANVAEPLVCYRVGAGAYARRGGLELLRSEVALQRRLHALGITSRTELVRNLAVRGGYRLVPEALRRAAYRRIIAPYGARHRRPRLPRG